MIRNGRRTLAALLALIMVLVLLPTVSAQADGEIEIANYEQLKAFAARVNGGEHGLSAKLTEDITCTDKTWTPIGLSGHTYQGRFNGQGHSITGLSNADMTYSEYVVAIGLFGDVGGSAVIQNVAVKNCDLTLDSGSMVYAGAIAAANGGTVENCYCTGTVRVASEEFYVGGIVGGNSGTVQNCYNTGTVGAACTGEHGIVYVGGVVGENSDSGTVKNCYNTGTVNAEKEVDLAQVNVGGVVGFHNGETVQDCHNTGAVSGSGEDTHVGGVVGYSYKKVQDCYNTGAVSGSDCKVVGGVVGYTKLTVQACLNTGEVSGGSGTYVGGIAGSNHYGSVESCLNIGEISGTGTDAAGVVGEHFGGAVKNCLSVGTVSGTARGGVVGWCVNNDSIATTIENCYYLNTAASAAIGRVGTATVTNVAALTAEQLKSLSNCVGFSTDTWYEGLSYPVLKNLSGEVHLYANSNEDLVIASYLPAFVPTKIANPFTYADHDFTGWNTDPDGNGDPYSEDDTFTLQPGEALTLHAQWKEADPVEIGTWADLDAALKAGGKYTLTADVAPENPYWADALTVPSGVTVTLDLNGHIVDRGYTEQGWDGSILIVSGNLTLLDSDPTATHDPAVAYTDPVTGRAITVNGGILKGGWPDQYGGGVQVQGGAVRMEGGSIACNSVGKNGFGAVAALGGGVYIQSGTFLMSGGAIVGNKASNKNTMMPDDPLGKGGAVYIAHGTFTLTGGLIRGNTAGEAAGGIYMGENGAFVMTGGTIVGNTAPGMNNFVDYNDNFSIDLAWITLNSNDGNGYVSEQTFTLNDTAPIATDIFVRDGYEFTDWNTKADGSGTPYADGADFYAGTETIGLALYAQWEQTVFTITFQNEDGTELQSGPVAVGETPVYEGDTPTKAPTVEHLYTFAGWKLLGTETVLTALPTVDGEATYVAAYTESDRVYTGPVWEWDGYETATATFTATDDTTFTQVLTATGDAITHMTTVEPDCEYPGVETYTAKVTFLGKDYFNDKTKEIAKRDHIWVFDEFVWTPNEQGIYTVVANFHCERYASHTLEFIPVAGMATDPATCTEDGCVHYVAFINAEESPDGEYHEDKLDIVIPAHGHQWSAPDYERIETETGYDVYAIVRCYYDYSHRIEETVHATYEVITPPTLEEEGLGRYTADFTDEHLWDIQWEVVIPKLALGLYGEDVDALDVVEHTGDGETLYRYDVMLRNDAEVLPIASVQMFIAYDDALTFVEAKTELHDAVIQDGNGVIALAWATDEGVMMENGTVVASLYFKLTGDVPNGGVLPFRFVEQNGNQSTVSYLADGTPVEAAAFETVDGSIVFAIPDAITIAGEDVLSGDIYTIEDGRILYRYNIRVRDLPEAGLWINSAQIFVSFDHAVLSVARTEGMLDWTTSESGDKLMAVWASDEDVQISEGDVVLTVWFEKIGEAPEDGVVPIMFTTNLMGNASAASITFCGAVAEIAADTVDGSITFEPILYGDANCDGEITAADAALILRTIVGLSELTPRGVLNADANGDLEITAEDAALILRYVVGLIGSLPA